MATNKSDFSSSLSSLESTLEEYFVDKAPYQFPQGVKEFIVTFAPWIIILSIILAASSISNIIGWSSFWGRSMMAARYGFSLGPLWWVSIALSVVAIVFNVLALKGLFNKSIKGWRYIFYSQLINIVALVFQSNIIGALISGIIGFYILFQVKEMYP